jgi:hypothetical protein
MSKNKDFHEQCINYVNKHNLSPLSLKIYRIIYLIIAAVSFIIGIPTLSFGGIIFIPIGILFLYLASRFKKILNELSKTAPTTCSRINNDINLQDISTQPVDEVVKVNNSLTFSSQPVENTPYSKSDDISIDDYNTEEFHVTGTSFRENDIESIGIENYEFDYSRKDFLEIFSEGQRIYKYLFAPKSVVLEEEPDNKYDKNAIKVIIDDVHVGYIKKEDCTHVKQLIDSKNIISIDATISGGKYRYYYEDYDDDAMDYKTHIKTERHNYSIYITLKLNHISCNGSV